MFEEIRSFFKKANSGLKLSILIPLLVIAAPATIQAQDEGTIENWVYYDAPDDEACYAYIEKDEVLFLVGFIKYPQTIKFTIWLQSINWNYELPLEQKKVRARMRPGSGGFTNEMNSVSDEYGNGFQMNLPVLEAKRFVEHLGKSEIISWSYKGDEIANLPTRGADTVISFLVNCMENRSGMSFGFSDLK